MTATEKLKARSRLPAFLAETRSNVDGTLTSVAENDRHLDLPRGFHDTGPEAMAVYRTLQQEWFDACALAGYQPVDVPPIGFQDTFTTGHNAAGEKLYQFADRSGRDFALVSDSLPAILRLAHARGLPEQRLSHCCAVFRYERRPRRHFHHLGLVEVVNRPSSLVEQQRSTLRIVQLVAGFLGPRRPATFTLTDPGIWHTLAAEFLPEDDQAQYLNVLHRLSRADRPSRLRHDGAPAAVVRLAEEFCTDPTLSDDGKFPVLQELPIAVRRRIDAVHELAAALRQRAIPADIDLGELHASEFHDGPSFLIQLQDDHRLLGDGGSYGSFASRFAGKPTSAYSAVIGLERLADLTTADHNDQREPAADVAILAQDEPEARSHADILTETLRSAGLHVWDVVLTRPLRRHLRDLASLRIPYSVVIGARDLDGATYTIRDQQGVLRRMHREQLIGWLRSHSPSIK